MTNCAGSTSCCWELRGDIVLDSLCIDQLVMIGRRSRAHNLLHGCDLQYLALVLVHECLSEEVLVHLLRKVLQYDIHHDLTIEIPRVYHVIHVQALPRI